ncbi:MAG: phosphate signaling complex protein PhoU [Clostridia bacterium]|nr:phosphate signaling complex protein PhoU [Clostridia bacterium]
MRSRFDEQLTALNHSLIEMGAMVEEKISQVTDALMRQDAELARSLTEGDEVIDEKERAIEDLCLRLLLQQQPVARDLRLISSALKFITDMERIGDQAADIAEIVLYLADQPYIKELVDLPKMAEATMKMVTGSIDAFVKKDLDLVRQVIDSDDVVDDLFATIKHDLIGHIQQSEQSAGQALDLLMIAKYYERIGDHAVNIAEWVYFSITGLHIDG